MFLILALISGYPEVMTVGIPERAPHFVSSFHTLGFGPSSWLLIYTSPFVDIVGADLSLKIIPFEGFSVEGGVVFPYPEYLLPLFIQSEDIKVDIEGNLFWTGFSAGKRILSFNLRHVFLKESSLTIFAVGGLVPLSHSVQIMYQGGFSLPYTLKYGIGLNFKMGRRWFFKLGIKEGVKDMGYQLPVIPYFDLGYVIEREGR